jgi:prolyl-tRNA editing enzyme YbaK/EbsC (Cys-tRNA(Pro) deacylase)
MTHEKIIMGGGNRSTKVLLAPSELTKIPTVVVVQDLAKLKNDEQS